MDNAKIEQWMKWTTATLQPMCNDVTKGILGNEEILDSAWKRSNNEMKNQVKIINQAVADNNGWLVGKEMTLADLFVAVVLTVPLQTAIDAGWRQKALVPFSGWAEKIFALPAIMKVLGRI